MIRLVRITILPVSLALVLAGCGGDGASGPPTGNSGGTAPPAASDITVEMKEFEFAPADVSIPADTATTVTVTNVGVVEHDWTIDALDVQIHADPGQSNQATITAAAGTYEIYCSIPGHKDSGMQATLTVG